MAPTRRLLLIIGIVMLAAAGIMANSKAYAGHKCPNRYFKKVPAEGVGDSEANATTAYQDDCKKKADKAKDDCKDCECEETGETCTFKYTYKTKPNCKENPPGAWKCKGWIRPGCFCMDKDEDFLTISPGSGAMTSESPMQK